MGKLSTACGALSKDIGRIPVPAKCGKATQRPVERDRLLRGRPEQVFQGFRGRFELSPSAATVPRGCWHYGSCYRLPGAWSLVSILNKSQAIAPSATTARKNRNPILPSTISLAVDQLTATHVVVGMHGTEGVTFRFVNAPRRRLPPPSASTRRSRPRSCATRPGLPCRRLPTVLLH